MSRHRDVRCMNYSEEYEGYDDVYGHSVEDDYCVSPSAEQFLFDRSKQQNIASFITEPDIIEDNEDNEELPISSNEEDVPLTEIERSKLMSCMESIKNVIGDTVSESEIKKKIIQSNFDAEVALDTVLKESSPKNEPSAANKDNLEPCPDATTTKPHISSLIIPKLSFNKQENIGSTNNNAYSVNNLGNFKNLSINDSPMRFSFLSEVTTNLADSLSNSTMDSFKNTSDTVAFKSLADLTAHHLQKSSNLISSTNSNETVSSPKTNFVIPKLSIKKDNSTDSSSSQLNSFNTQETVNIESDRKMDDCMDSLEKRLSNVLDFSKNHTGCTSKNNSQNLEAKENSVLDISDMRTPSPDPWIIDLSAALKEATSLVSNICSLPTSKAVESTNISNITSSSNLQTSNHNVEISYTMLPTTLNVSCLGYVKLPYTKKNVSLFGRTLCRTWKLRKPVLKLQKQHCETIKRFDFSVPYSRT